MLNGKKVLITGADGFIGSHLTETNDAGVMTRPAWTLMNKLEMFKHCETDGLDNAQWLEDRLVNIPSGVMK